MGVSDMVVPPNLGSRERLRAISADNWGPGKHMAPSPTLLAQQQREALSGCYTSRTTITTLDPLWDPWGPLNRPGQRCPETGRHWL